MRNKTSYVYLVVLILHLLATTDQEIATSTDILETICKRSVFRKQRKVLCLEQTLKISCPVGTIVVFIDANFGRSSPDPCPRTWGYENRNCYTNSHTLNILRNRCHNTYRCSVEVSTDVFGSPDVCYTITKYLDVTYGCEQEICQGQPDKSEQSKDITTVKPYNTIRTAKTTTGKAGKSENRNHIITSTLPFNITQTDSNTTSPIHTGSNNTGHVIGAIVAAVIGFMILATILIVLVSKRVCNMCKPKTPASLSATYDVLNVQRNAGADHIYADTTPEQVYHNDGQREL